MLDVVLVRVVLDRRRRAGGDQVGSRVGGARARGRRPRVRLDPVAREGREDVDHAAVSAPFVLKVEIRGAIAAAEEEGHVAGALVRLALLQDGADRGNAGAGGDGDDGTPGPSHVGDETGTARHLKPHGHPGADGEVLEVPGAEALARLADDGLVLDKGGEDLDSDNVVLGALLKAAATVAHAEVSGADDGEEVEDSAQRHLDVLEIAQQLEDGPAGPAGVVVKLLFVARQGELFEPFLLSLVLGEKDQLSDEAPFRNRSDVHVVGQEVAQAGDVVMGVEAFRSATLELERLVGDVLPAHLLDQLLDILWVVLGPDGHGEVTSIFGNLTRGIAYLDLKTEMADILPVVGGRHALVSHQGRAESIRDREQILRREAGWLIGGRLEEVLLRVIFEDVVLVEGTETAGVLPLENRVLAGYVSGEGSPAALMAVESLFLAIPGVVDVRARGALGLGGLELALIVADLRRRWRACGGVVLGVVPHGDGDVHIHLGD